MDKRLKNIQEIDNTLDKIKKEFYKYLKDKSIPLEDRWKAFNKYSEYLTSDESSCCDDIGVFELCSIYNPPDRYRTYSYSEIIDQLEEYLILKSHSDYQIKYHIFRCCSKNLEQVNIVYDPKEDISIWNEKVTDYLNSLKEEILENHTVGFYYDW